MFGRRNRRHLELFARPTLVEEVTQSLHQILRVEIPGRGENQRRGVIVAGVKRLHQLRRDGFNRGLGGRLRRKVVVAAHQTPKLAALDAVGAIVAPLHALQASPPRQLQSFGVKGRTPQHVEIHGQRWFEVLLQAIEPGASRCPTDAAVNFRGQKRRLFVELASRHRFRSPGAHLRPRHRSQAEMLIGNQIASRAYGHA